MQTKGTSAVGWFYGADAVLKSHNDALALIELLLAQAEEARRTGESLESVKARAAQTIGGVR
jgi:hypothetical protein